MDERNDDMRLYVKRKDGGREVVITEDNLSVTYISLMEYTGNEGGS